MRLGDDVHILEKLLATLQLHLYIQYDLPPTCHASCSLFPTAIACPTSRLQEREDANGTKHLLLVPPLLLRTSCVFRTCVNLLAVIVQACQWVHIDMVYDMLFVRAA